MCISMGLNGKINRRYINVRLGGIFVSFFRISSPRSGEERAKNDRTLKKEEESLRKLEDTSSELGVAYKVVKSKYK
jgi:hypothetical protein